MLSDFEKAFATLSSKLIFKRVFFKIWIINEKLIKKLSTMEPNHVVYKMNSPMTVFIFKRAIDTLTPLHYIFYAER